MSTESRYERLEAVIVDGLKRAPGAEPSAELDARILARAHAAVATTPVRRTQPRWMAMAAGVVVLVGSGLALRIMQQVERDPGPVGAPMQSVPASAAAPQSSVAESAPAKAGESLHDEVVADDAFRQDSAEVTTGAGASDAEAPEKVVAPAPPPPPSAPPPEKAPVASAPAIITAQPQLPAPKLEPESRPQAFPADSSSVGYGPAAPAPELDTRNEMQGVDTSPGSDRPVAADADLAGAAPSPSAAAAAPMEARREDKQLAQPFETRAEGVASRAPSGDLRDRAAAREAGADEGRLGGALQHAAPDPIAITGATVPIAPAPVATAPATPAPIAPPPEPESVESMAAPPAPIAMPEPIPAPRAPPAPVTEERELSESAPLQGGFAEKPGMTADLQSAEFERRIVVIRAALARRDRVFALDQARKLAREFPDRRLPRDLELLIAR